jgi:signal transduction histidine kinase/ActR/RegA family two-component response regulator
MSKPREQATPEPARTTRPPKSELTESDGWKSSAQTQRLLHELRVHQIELEMQNEELRASRVEVEAGLKRYTDLYDFAPVGYVTLSPEGTLRELNLPAARLLNRERARLVSARLRTFISQGTRATFDAWLATVFVERDERTCEVVLIRDDLPPLAAQLTAKLSLDGQCGRVVITDTSARKALEEELRQAQKMEVVGQLAGGVAHDFNNILAAMLLSLGALRAHAESPAESELALSGLEELAKRAARLTSQLLLFSRRQVLQPQRLELNGALSHLLEMLERLLGDEVSCNFYRGEPELWVEADLVMWEQAVMNLCLNARDAMPNGGNLILHTSLVEIDTASARLDPKSRPGKFVCLQVSDTGAGMTAEVLEHVFEPFFTTKEAGHGTGLGLASVYGTVSQHGGWLKVESRLGHGTSFRMYLPESAKGDTVRAPAPKTIDTNGKGETILLVEDEPALLAVAARSLRRRGYNVICAGNAAQALELWPEHEPVIDLLLTDMRMPGGMNGLALAERLLDAKPSLKVIVMSGYNTEMPVSAGRRFEFSYLGKPFELAALTATVRTCLDAKTR